MDACFVSCTTWIKKGASKRQPDKVELTKEELAKVIEETKGKLRDVEIDSAEEDEAKEADNSNGDVAPRPSAANGDAYDMEHYDDEEEGDGQNVLALGQLARYASNAEDPYVTRQDSEDSDDSEAADLEVRPDENLIVSGQVDGDASTIVFHVFNEEEGSMYVHHDILLGSYPICVEWLNYESAQSPPANLVAVGSMSSVIEVWDVDVVNSFEPAYKLGRRPKKKKGKPGLGHTDAVLSLAWNRHIGHVLASGSADETVLLWDLETRRPATTLHCKEKVQTVTWHPRELDQLLSADCAGDVRVWQCQAEESKRWRLAGEVESASWDHFNPTGVLAATDDGKLHYIDTRSEKKTLWSVQAHEDACTGLVLSPEVAGLLVTISSDRTLKVWDVLDQPEQPVTQKEFKLGSLHCAAFCPDLPWMLCVGGDNKENVFRLWDVRDSDEVRRRFGGRPLTRVLPEPEMTEAAPAAMETEAAAAQLEEMSLETAQPGPSGATPGPSGAQLRTTTGKKLNKRHKGKGGRR